MTREKRVLQLWRFRVWAQGGPLTTIQKDVLLRLTPNLPQQALLAGSGSDGLLGSILQEWICQPGLQAPC